MVEMTPQRWQYTNEYSREVFGREDAHLAGLMKHAVARGLPDIAVSADVGRLLMMLTSMTPGRRAIEIGTLGGYSGIWIARGLSPSGRLITIEPVDLHADFAIEQFKLAGVNERVELRRGKALDILPQLSRELGPLSVDVVFMDAIKTEYPDYWQLVQPLIAVGGLIIADNVYGSGDWWIDHVNDPSRAGADRFNRLVADDPVFEAVAVPIRQGVLVGRRTG
jgi:caffeoyl-CoA O-methyltransferase